MKKTTLRKKGIMGAWLALAGTALFAAAANAQSATPVVSKPQDLLNILCNVAQWMVYFLLALSVIMIMVGAFYYLTAQGDAEKVTKATRTLTFAAVGIVVTLLAYSLPKVIATFIGANTAGGCVATGAPAASTQTQSTNTSNNTTDYTDQGQGDGIVPFVSPEN